MEKGGLKVKDILGAKNPFKWSNCSEKTCPLCTKSDIVDIETEEVKIPCSTNNVGYRWRCLTCKEKDIVKVYEGETGRSARLRGGEHLKDFEKNREKSVLLKHKISRLTAHNHPPTQASVQSLSWDGQPWQVDSMPGHFHCQP